MDTNDPSPLKAASDLAKQAYEIYRGMVREPIIPPPHWDDLTGEQRGLLEWTARFVSLHHMQT